MVLPETIEFYAYHTESECFLLFIGVHKRKIQQQLNGEIHSKQKPQEHFIGYLPFQFHCPNQIYYFSILNP